jgi:predicted RNA binding protein YcfA (HicA-like mRNA interferase family)
MAMKVHDIIKLLEEDGWYLVATKGSYRQYKHSEKKGRVTVAGKPSADLHPKKHWGVYSSKPDWIRNKPACAMQLLSKGYREVTRPMYRICRAV